MDLYLGKQQIADGFELNKVFDCEIANDLGKKSCEVHLLY